MASPAIENIILSYPGAEVNFIGTESSLGIYKNHPSCNKTFLVNKNYFELYHLSKKIKKVDIFFTFRSSLRSKIFSLFIGADFRFLFSKKKYIKGHQVEKYNDFVNQSLGINLEASQLIVHKSQQEIYRKKFFKKTIGLNPGASYGDAKCWPLSHYIELSVKISNDYEIVLLGSANEARLTRKIQNGAIENNVKQIHDFAGRTSINDLINIVSELDILITGDSGTMHLAAAFNIPTIAIFGPTDSSSTSQWKNKNSVILSRNLECQPCMKRSCPLLHHNCMKSINPDEVIDAIMNIDKKEVL